MNKASKGGNWGKEGENVPREGHGVGAGLEQGKCRECVWGPGTVNGEAGAVNHPGMQPGGIFSPGAICVASRFPFLT